MKYSIVFSFLLLVLVGCQGNKNLETAVISTPTTKCGSCAKNIEKAVYAVEGVKAVGVDLKAKTVAVKYVPEQTNAGTLERAIADAGYDANQTKRDPGAYERLDACCKDGSTH